MNRILNAKTFTCRGCRRRCPRDELAMTTSQCGLCVTCYVLGKRLVIVWFAPLAYSTRVVDADHLPDPDQPRGAHNLMIE